MFRRRCALFAGILVFTLVFSAFGGSLPAKAGEVVDLGFEDGTLDGWAVVSNPDAVSISAGDAYAEAYWGDFMAVLGTPAAGNATQPFGPNSIAKTFTVLTEIAFAYNMFTSDYPSLTREIVVNLLSEFQCSAVIDDGVWHLPWRADCLNGVAGSGPGPEPLHDAGDHHSDCGRWNI